MLKEFKEFALKGNVLDLAIGVVIGTAFQAIVKSLVDDVIMPLLSIIIGNVDFSQWVLQVGHSSIPYGKFISAVVNFTIVAFSLFLVVKYINKLNTKLAQAKNQEVEKLQKLKDKSKIYQKFMKKDKQENKEAKESESEPELKTKLCPYCFSEINVYATRCPHCTSKLKEDE